MSIRLNTIFGALSRTLQIRFGDEEDLLICRKTGTSVNLLRKRILSQQLGSELPNSVWGGK